MLTEAGITNMDIGGFSKLANAVTHMKGKVYLHGGLNCKDFYGDGPMPPETRQKALAAMRLAGPVAVSSWQSAGKHMSELPPQGICDMARLVEERGKYPLNISEKETA